jgi:tetratricopeptide (TPR) repeat protein
MRKFILFLSLVAALSQIGCAPAVIVRPIYDVQEGSPKDPRIEGEWITPSLEDSAAQDAIAVRWSVKLSPSSNDKTNSYTVTMVSGPEQGSTKAPETQEFEARLVPIGEKLFFDAKPQAFSVSGQDVKEGDLSPGIMRGHVVGLLSIEEDFLRVAVFDSDWAAQHLPESMWAGDSQGDTKVTILTAPTAEMRKVLLSNADDAKAFPYVMYLCRAGGLPCAARTVEDALARHPKDGEVLRDGAKFYLRRGDYEQAVNLRRRCLELDSTDRIARRDLADALLLSRGYADARKEFEAVHKMEPLDKVQYEVGLSYFLEGDYDKTVAVLAPARTIKSYWEPQVLMLSYFSLLRLGHAAEAQRLLEKEAPNMLGTWDGKFFLPDFTIVGNDHSRSSAFSAYPRQLFQALHWAAQNEKEKASLALTELVTVGNKDDLDCLMANVELERLKAGARRR